MMPSEVDVARLKTYAEKSPWARSQELGDQLHQNWHECSGRQGKLLEEARLRDQATPTSEVGVTWSVTWLRPPSSTTLPVT